MLFAICPLLIRLALFLRRQSDAGGSNLAIINIGKRGTMLVAVSLSWSEGEWGREQKILFEVEERQTVEFFFHEPTTNATNIQTRTRLIPRLSE